MYVFLLYNITPLCYINYIFKNINQKKESNVNARKIVGIKSKTKQIDKGHHNNLEISKK